MAAIIASCSPVDAPRQAEPGAITSVITYESPRVEYVVAANPDIGNVTFRGVVTGRSPAVVLSPSDGRVLEVFVANDDPVVAGDVILNFLPAPSEAELIDLDIAELTIARAVADGAGAAVVRAAEEARDDLIASYQDRVETIVAPGRGVLVGTRQNVEYSVRQDQRLFEIADPRDLVVTVRLRSDETELVTIDAPVVMTRAGNDADIIGGTIATVRKQLPAGSDTDDLEMTVVPDDRTGIALGDQLSVSLAASTGNDGVWIPRQAIGFQSGSSYVLVADRAGRLERRDVALGRRTLTHVEVTSGLAAGSILVEP